MKYGSPPYGHAEDSSLEMYCKRTGIDLEAAMTGLTAAGFAFTGIDQTIEEIALANNVTPKEIADSFTPETLSSPTLGGFGSGKRMGFMTLPQVSEATGVELSVLEAKLKEAGYSADTTKTLKELAAEKGVHPSELVALMGLDEFH